MEHPLVTAVTHSTAETRITLLGVPDQPGIAGRIFRALADANVNVDMIIQNEPLLGSGARRADMSFTVPREDGRIARQTLDAIVGELGIEHVAAEESMGKVSIVGAGMRSHPGVAATVFTVLGDAGINIEMISTSPIKISCVIAGDRVPDAVRGLHSAFGLSGTDTIKAEDPFGDPR
jgi:aspartate kinase